VAFAEADTGGVPLLDPRPRDDDDAVRDGGGCGRSPVVGVGGCSQNINLPYHVFFHSVYSLSSLLLSNADRYLSYDSRNAFSTREEKISSPRGFFAGGMGGMVRVVDADLDLVPGGEGDRELDKIGESLGLGKKKESGFHLDRRGGFTFRYMLNERSARFV
jgi:hypothetical protein